MKKLPLSILSALALASATQAQTTVNSDPVGFVSVNVNANSDATLGLPLHRPTALQTTVSSVNGNVITINATVTSGQFVYASPTQKNHYYLNIRSATNASVVGNWYEISANTATTVTVIPNSSGTVQSQGLGTGDTVEIIPFWSLTSLFPSGQGVVATSDTSSLKTQVFMMPSLKSATSGTDLGASKVFIYYNGLDLPAGWYDLGTGSPADDEYFIPDTYLVMRNVGAARTVSTTGSVPMSNFASALGTVTANTIQDNLAVNPLPVSLNLTQLNLFQSGAFVSTTDTSAVKDQLLLFDSATTGYDAAPSKVLIYWTGGQGLANGWYNLGTGDGPLDTTEIVAPGVGFIVRKAGTANPTSTRWVVNKTY